MKKNKKGSIFSKKKLNASLILILILAFLLRFFYLQSQPVICDEGLIVASLKSYFQLGIFPFHNRYHPIFRYLFTYFSTSLLGETIFAYRFFSAIFAVLSVLLTYFLISQLLNSRVALLAALLLASDPIHTAFSRLAIEESQMTFLILLSLFLTLKYAENKNILFFLPLGFTLGMGISTKWSFLSVYLYILFYLSRLALREKKTFLLAPMFTSLILLPFSVYIFSFLPWFKRGYTFFDWLSFQKIMASSIINTTAADYGSLLGFSSSAWLWFIRPLHLSYFQQIQDNQLYSVAGFTNPFTWLIFLPCLIFLLISPETKKLRPLFLTPLLFVFPLLLSDRPFFLYSATPLAPFVSIVSASAIFFLSKRYRSLRPILTVYLVLAATLPLILFPLEIGYPVNQSFYQAIFSLYAK